MAKQFKVGQYVKVDDAIWVIEDIYTSPFSGKVVAELYGVDSGVNGCRDSYPIDCLKEY